MNPLERGEAAEFVTRLTQLANLYAPKVARAAHANEKAFQALELAVTGARHRVATLVTWHLVGRPVGEALADARRALAEAEERAQDARLVRLVVHDLIEESREQVRSENENVSDRASAMAEERKVYDRMIEVLDRDWLRLNTPDIRSRGAAIEKQSRKAGCYQQLKEVVRERFAGRPRGDVLVDLLRLDGA